MHHGIGKQCYQRLNIDEITQYLKSKDATSWKNHMEEKHHRYHSFFIVQYLSSDI